MKNSAMTFFNNSEITPMDIVKRKHKDYSMRLSRSSERNDNSQIVGLFGREKQGGVDVLDFDQSSQDKSSVP